MTETAKAAGQIPRILLVDDDNDVLVLFSKWLKAEKFDVVAVESGKDALAQISITRPDLVVTDMIMDEMDGMALLSEVHRQNPLLPVIMLSGQAKIPDAVKATHLGSSAFLTKPVDKKELVSQIKKHLHLASKGHVKKSQLFDREIIYRSSIMAELMEQGKAVSDSDITVFISGETGTGKEILAKAIHDASPRKDKPFIGVNCGAIPEQLLESELFGHEKGAFTGAMSQHEGLFKAADGGTLFLDEIGDLPLELQVKLLRVLQDFLVRPVGSVRSVPINVRIISATHTNLEEAVKAGRFRADLYYRLNVVPLAIPALSERPEDIELLLEHYLTKFAQKKSERKKSFSPDALNSLIASAWPGNVRQLINVVDLCATLNKTNIIPIGMVQKALGEQTSDLRTLKDAKHSFERDYLISVLQLTKGQVANSARIAGRNRTEFYKLLSAHKIDPTDFRKPTDAS